MARAIADVLTRGAPALTESTFVALIEPVLRQFAPINALSLTRPPGSPRRVVVDFGSVTVPIPQPPGTDPRVLTAVFERGYRPDGWTQQWLEVLACLAGVCPKATGADHHRPLSLARGRSAVDPAHDGLIGSSVAMAELRKRVARFAATDSPVLILGESGTGKELIARALHRQSRRARGPFLPVSCASIVSTLLETEFFGVEEGTATGVKARKGKFELARGGTLFLDEIADLSAKGQASLLRVLQERSLEPVGGHRTIEVDVRIIAATNRPVIGTSRFRSELYYRLCVLPLHVPPLRERGRDVLELTQAFLEDDWRGWHWSLEPDAAHVLLTCEWPGNVRQLQSLVRLIQADAESPVADVSLVNGSLAALGITPRAKTAGGSTLTMKASRALHALRVLQACGGNKTRAAAQLGISVPTLRAHLRQLDAPPMVQIRRRAA